jgi:hypothetical protein
VVLSILIGVGKNLVLKLEIKFPTHGVMDALGIVCPKYWMQPKCDATFFKHLQIIKSTFYMGKTHKVDD